MSRIQRMVVLAVAAALAISTLAVTASADHERTYRVTVTNLTEGQPQTPFVVATHSEGFSLFSRGASASNGLQQLAENGGVPVLVDELLASGYVGDVQVAATAAGPLFPGDSASVDVIASSSARFVSLAGMLICTNDGFGGLSNVKLPTDSKTVYGYAYDAGTEINTEAYSDLVPPCDGLGQTGMTNPALAENGVVHRHRGIAGIADLSPAVHGWTGAVIMVEIELID
ncbi:MAG: spondin domain-containing protein [Acidimicrobiia bacterium]|nr:spondin domain-containing protein [Acidimicrobiia bacterium]